MSMDSLFALDSRNQAPIHDTLFTADNRGQVMNRRLLWERLAFLLVILATLISLCLLGGLLVHIVGRGMAYVNWTFIVSDLWPMIVTTVVIVVLCVGIAAPLGILGALYLTEFAPAKSSVARLIRLAAQSLAGMPSIIYGLFGLAFFVSTLELGFSILAGLLTLAILILPLILQSSEEALRTVPDSLRLQSLALGASRIYTIFHLILPSAGRGILTAIILSVGRAISESAPLFLTAGMIAQIPESVFDSGRTLSVHLYVLAQELFSGQQWGYAYGTATVLIIVILIINSLIFLLSVRIDKNNKH